MIQDEVTQRKGLINVWIQLLLWESAGRRFISRRPNSPLSSSWGSSRRWMKVQWQVNPCALVRRTPRCSAFTPQRSRRLASCFHPGLRRSEPCAVFGGADIQMKVKPGINTAHQTLMPSEISDPLVTAEIWKKGGREVAIATVIETWGSAPRSVGSHLVIDRDGNFEGSVSGGCVEGAVIAEAIEPRSARAVR
jgi:hypothetical protein